MILSYYIIILLSMTTISVPLPADLLKALENFIRDEGGTNKAAVMRKALERYLEEQAVQAVLQAQKEPRLEGNLRDLAKKIR